MAKKEDNLEKLCGVPTGSAVLTNHFSAGYEIAVVLGKKLGIGSNFPNGVEIAALLDDAVKNSKEVTITGEYLTPEKLDIKILEVGSFCYKALSFH